MACIKTKKYVVELFNNLVNIFPQTGGGGGGLEKCLQESHFSWYLLQIWNINSWDMWLSTHYFSGFLQDWFHVFLYEIKKNSVWYNFYQGTSVSITFYIFEHYQLWMMDSKGQRVFFPKTPQLCVWHTEVRRCYHFKLVSHFQLWFPIWGVLVNRLSLYQTKIQILRAFARMFSARGMNIIAARRWWSERGLKESCEWGCGRSLCVARSSCYKHFWTRLLYFFWHFRNLIK